MSVNKYAPHVFVLPEDDANARIANGFQLALPDRNFRRLQILPEAGGWVRVRDNFLSNEVAGMENNADRYMVLVVDLDRKRERLPEIAAAIPAHLRERVFIIGSLSEALRNRSP